MIDLRGLARLSQAVSRCVSPENPTGSASGGALADPGGDSPARRLGRGWKVRPWITLPAGQDQVLADIAGPGTITHLWLTVDVAAYRDCVLRIFWDGEAEPSVECPVGDFFAVGHGVSYVVNSLPVSVNPTGGFNCYWPMPFRQRCLITLENQSEADIPALYYAFDYELHDVPDDVAYFHAQWRRTQTSRTHPEHVLLDGVQGQGHYVGTFLAWTQLNDGWWGEGEVKFFLDGEDSPTICGTGTEDYVGGAWCFGAPYSTPFLGYPWASESGVPKHALYRWHVADPIRFRTALAVTVQALGWWPDKTFQPLADDVASVAYWYQTEPHAPFPSLPDREMRWPR
jgi:hypothetical protein